MHRRAGRRSVDQYRALGSNNFPDFSSWPEPDVQRQRSEAKQALRNRLNLRSWISDLHRSKTGELERTCTGKVAFNSARHAVLMRTSMRWFKCVLMGMLLLCATVAHAERMAARLPLRSTAGKFSLVAFAEWRVSAWPFIAMVAAR